MLVETKFEFNQCVRVESSSGKTIRDWIKAVRLQPDGNGGIWVRYELTYTSGLFREVDLKSVNMQDSDEIAKILSE